MVDQREDFLFQKKCLTRRTGWEFFPPYSDSLLRKTRRREESPIRFAYNPTFLQLQNLRGNRSFICSSQNNRKSALLILLLLSAERFVHFFVFFALGFIRHDDAGDHAREGADHKADPVSDTHGVEPLALPYDDRDHDDLEGKHQRDTKGDRLDLQDQVRHKDVADHPGKKGDDKELEESAFREEARGLVDRADPALFRSGGRRGDKHDNSSDDRLHRECQARGINEVMKALLIYDLSFFILIHYILPHALLQSQTLSKIVRVHARSDDLLAVIHRDADTVIEIRAQ